MAKKTFVRKGFMRRSPDSLDFYNTKKNKLRWMCIELFGKYWKGIKEIAPFGKWIPIEYRSTKDSFTIKVVKK